MKKSALTILEVLIAMGLTALLLALLLPYFYRFAICKRDLAQKEQEASVKTFIQQRLAQVMNRAHPDSFKASEERFAFRAHYGIDADPDFNGDLDVEIFQNEEKEIILKWIPENKKIEPKEELLLKNVSDFSYRFFEPQELKPSLTWEEGIPFMIELQFGKLQTVYFFYSHLKYHEALLIDERTGP